MAKTYAELIVYLHMDAQKGPLDNIEKGILQADCEVAKLQVENKRLKEAHRIYKLLLDSCDKHCDLYTKVKDALGEIDKIMKSKP